MRLFSIFLTATASFSYFTPQALSAVVARDWKTPGDGLLTYDDQSHREWLDLSLTRLSLFPGSDQEVRFLSVVGETASGGIFDGFSIAKSPDVTQLAQSAGIEVSTSDFDTNALAVSRLIELLSPTWGAPPGFSRAQGYLDELNSPPSLPRRAAAFHYSPLSSARLFSGIGDDSFLIADRIGVMLYRQVVPEPSLISLSVVAFIVSVRFRTGRSIAARSCR